MKTPQTQTPRAPVVAVMGHIDHGKSSLLDYIRESNTVAAEAGGITQHISAYEVVHKTSDGKEAHITFLDTPGHAAFQAMRSCGAEIADIAILVVAADDGVKPQTLDALTCIKESGIPYIVAFTKIDKPEAQIERAKASLIEHEIYLEGLGGEVPFALVSSKTGEGIPELLDLLTLTAELEELSGDLAAPATGVVLESSQDPKQGSSATLIIKNGTLETGMVAVAGSAIAPVRFIEDYTGKRIASAQFSQPVRITGFSALPGAGTLFESVQTKKEAERIAQEKTITEKQTPKKPASDTPELPLIIKTDVFGSISAITHELAKLSHEHITLRILDTSVGTITEGDVKQATAGGAVVVGFHTKVDTTARDVAKRTGVTVQTFDVIYDLVTYVETLLKERAPKVTVEQVLGTAKIIKLFNRTGTKQVLGGKVREGELRRGARVRILRRDILIGEGVLSNLQSAKANVDRVTADTEFGGEIDTKAEMAPGDIIEAYEMVES